MLYRAEDGWDVVYIEQDQVIEHLEKGFTICRAEEEKIEERKQLYRDNLYSLIKKK